MKAEKKTKYIIANWKSNFTETEALQWVSTFISYDFSSSLGNFRIIICPPAPFLSLAREKTKHLSFVQVGAQDVSFFPEGAYTGEINARALTGFAHYAIIGHSERRYYFGETERILSQKCSEATKNGLEPIFCVRAAGDSIPSHVRFVAYEPVEAIGTGNNEPLKKVLAMKKNLRLLPETYFIYGGSVQKSNAGEYLNNPEIDGLLVGRASRDPQSFFEIIKQYAA